MSFEHQNNNTKTVVEATASPITANSSKSSSPAPMDTFPMTGTSASKHAKVPTLNEKIQRSKDKLTSKLNILADMDIDHKDYYNVSQEVALLTRHIETLQTSQKVLNNTISNNTNIRMTYKDVPLFYLDGQVKNDTNAEVFKSAELFLEKFERILISNGVNLEADWEQWVHCAMVGDSSIWFKDHLKGKSLSWSTASKLIIDTFDAKDKRIKNALNVVNMKMHDGESVNEFGLRFQAAYYNAKWSDDEIMAVLCLRALPRSLQHGVLIAMQGRDDNIDGVPSSSSVVLNIARNIHAQKRAFDHEGESSDSKRSKRRTSSDRFPVKDKYCSEHGKRSSHTTEECKVLKNKIVASKLIPKHAPVSTSVATNNVIAGKQCWNCPEVYTPEHKLHCKGKQFKNQTYRVQAINASTSFTNKNVSTPKVTAIPTLLLPKHHADIDLNLDWDELEVQAAADIEETLEDAMDVEGNKDKNEINININMITTHHTNNNNPFILPLIVNDIRMKALLDTGADVSVISLKFCSNNNIKFNKNQHVNLHFVTKNNSSSHIGLTGPVSIKYNGLILTHSFHVLELSSNDYDILIGRDLIPKLDIGFLGLAYNWDDNKIQIKNNDDKELLEIKEPNNSPAGTKEERIIFIDSITPYIDENQLIPKTSFCTLDISVVKLNTPTMPSNDTNHRQYPIAYTMQPLVDEAVETWLEEGTITIAPVDTTWNSPITLAPKKDEYGNITGKRPCLDPRHINKHLQDDIYPLPLINEIFENMHGSKIFTTLDLKSAFHRFMIHPDDQHKTTFTHKGRQYMFKGCPFGLKPLSSKFQRVMHHIFNGLPYVQTFVDDVVIHSKNMTEHIEHVSIAIKKLTSVNLILNPKKCHFAQTCVYLLGFCISDKGHDLDPRKVTNVLEWQRPKTGHAVQQFLGIVNYFRLHIANIAALTAPIDALRNYKNITNNDWTLVHEKHFNTIKQELQNNTLLHFPDLSKTFYVATDASDYGIGASLFQKINGKERHIGYMAKSLSKSQRNYSTNKRELLAIVFALKKYHKFLWGKPFVLYTDHRALTYLHTQKIASPMMIQWLDTLLDYSFTIIHLPGKLNTLPDLLSRLDIPDKEMEGDNKPNKSSQHLLANKGYANKKPNKIIKEKLDKIKQKEPYFEEKHFIQVIQNQTTDYITPPANQHKSILQRVHSFGHFGAEAIVKTVHNEGLHWVHIMKDALEIVKECPACQKYNIVRRGYNPLRPVFAYLPGDHWAIDLCGPFPTSTKGNNYLLVMVDVCTRFNVYRPLPDKKSDTVIHTLIQVFGDFGYPKIVQSDNGTEFKNQFFKNLYTTMNIDHRLSTPYHPRGNGVAERYVRIAQEIIQKHIQGTKVDWDWYTPIAQLAVNHKISKRLQTAPFSLMFARHMNTSYAALDKNKTDTDITSKNPISYQKLLDRMDYMADIVFPAIKERTDMVVKAQKEAFNKKYPIVNFPINSYVVARLPTRTSKLAPVYEGPYIVVNKTENGNYILKDMTGALTSRNYTPSELKLISHDETIPTDEIYEVEAIINHRGTEQNREYKIRWKGYSAEDDTWEKSIDINAQDCIDTYWKRINILKGKEEKKNLNEKRNPLKRKQATSVIKKHGRRKLLA